MYVNGTQLTTDPKNIVLSAKHFTSLLSSEKNPNFKFESINPVNMYPDLNWNLSI